MVVATISSNSIHHKHKKELFITLTVYKKILELKQKKISSLQFQSVYQFAVQYP